MNKIKVGIIGIGNMGKNHVRIVRDLNNYYDLVAIYDPDKKRIEELKIDNLGVDSEEELMKVSDAIIIAAPSFLHKKLATMAQKHDKHVFIEKPLALSYEDGKEVVDMFDNSNKVLMIGHVERFNPVVVELGKIVAKEKIIAIQMSRCSPMDRRITDTDVVYDLMIHDADILINALMKNVEIETSSALGKIVYSEKNVDYVQANFNFTNGVIASIVSSRVTEDKIRQICIHCEGCYIVADLLNRTLTLTRKTLYKLDVGYNPVYKQENILERVMVPNTEPLKEELEHFATCIFNKEIPIPNGKDSLNAIRVLDQIKKKLYDC